MLLEVQGLTVQISTPDGVIKAADGVSFSVDAGKTLGLVGESGCGKSVTALSLLRLLPEPPASIVSGSVLFEGTDLLRLDAESLRRVRGAAIGFVFQDPMSALNPCLKIGHQIAEAITSHRPGLSKREASSKAVEWLARVGLADPERRFHDYPHELSGGQRQRVLIAQALACGPKLLIADEPTTALDVTIQAQILGLIGKLKQELGMAVILITHDLGIVAEQADDVIVMYAGKIVERANSRELFARPLHPYTRALLASVPPLDADSQPGKLPVIEGTVPSLLELPTGCRFQDRCPLVQPRCRKTEPLLEQKAPGRLAACFEV